MFQLLILGASLRKASSSAALSRAIEERMAAKASISHFDIARLPHYNADLDKPEGVAELIAAIGAADGVLFVTAEYNYSIPGVLKNAIDWASRPAYESVFRGKPCFVVTTSGGAMGGVRAQSHLKYILNGMLARVFPWQEAIVPFANKKTVEGRFADEDTLAFIETALDAFADWARSVATGEDQQG
ncbi:MAG: NAD(P)H-dependent oxidoreductase [Mesorhizobium sp.]|nr:NAD(P)H-dependent oxidoreductase [Mesorhizobium sp.]